MTGGRVVGMQRTTYRVTVLSPEPIPECMTFPDVVREAIVGTYVLEPEKVKTIPLTRRQMRKALIAAGTHPGFFDL